MNRYPAFIQNWLRLKRLLLPMFRDGLLLAGYQRHEGVATLIVLLCRRKQSSTSGIVDLQVANAHQEKAFAIAHLIFSGGRG